MASVEKIKRKKEKSKIKPSSKSSKSEAVAPIENASSSTETLSPNEAGDTSDSQPGSMISVREAARRDKADSLQNGKDPAGSRPNSARPRSAVSVADERPSSAVSTTSTLRASSRPPSATPGPSMLATRDDSRPSSAMSHKSYRKNKTNAIEPDPSAGSPVMSRSNSHMGSRASVKSKEAWMEDADKPWTENGLEDNRSLSSYKQSPVQSLSPTNSVSSKKKDEVSLSKSMASLFGPPDLNLAHAYIPYLYARGCIAKMVEDMKKMKSSHIHIVNGIETNYKAIEDETQSQFNMFVFSLRDQYGHKVKTFRQVVEVHRIELQQKQQYWDEALSSMSGKNKHLLEDKKMLLIQNKVEFERLEKEKEEAVADLTHKLDDKEKILIDTRKQCEDEQKENENLRRIIEELRNRPEVEVPVMASVAANVQSRPFSAKSVQVDLSPAPLPLVRQRTVVVTDLSEEERKRMEEERKRMAEEREKMREEREDWEKERDDLVEERKKYQEDRIILQGDLNTANKDKETWKAKYEDLKAQLEELGDLRAKYDALQAQFAAMAAVATVSSEDDKKKTDEKIQEAAQDKVIMEEQKTVLADDLKAWEADFKEEHGREPTEEDKSDSAKEMESSLAEANNMIANLDAQIDTMEKLKSGEVPEPPKMEPTIIVKEPEIRIIEIKIPDPEVVAALEMTQEELESMRKQLIAMKTDKSKLQDANSRLEGEVSDLTRAVAQLEAANKELEIQLEEALRKLAGMGSGGGADPTELAALQKKNKELERDLKKAKLQKKSPETTDTEEVEGDVEELEEKIAELENKLIDQNGLQDNLSDLERRLAEALALVAALKNREQELEQALRDQKAEHEKELQEKDLEHDRKMKELEKEHDKVLKEKEEEKRDMEKDIKKLLKHIDKLRKKLAALEGTAPDDSDKENLEDKVSELEDKVSDLEADKDHLTTDKKDLEDKVEKLERELAEAQDKLVGLPVPVPTDDLDDLRKKIKELEELLKQKDKEMAEAEKEHKAEMREKEKLIKEMEQDMKKMLRRIDKLQKKLAAMEENTPKENADDEKEKLEKEVERLEENVADLEAKVENLNSDKEDQEQKIAELTAALAVASANEGENEVLQKQADRAEAELREERSDHEIIREELHAMRRQIVAMKTEMDNQKHESEANLDAAVSRKDAEIDSLRKTADQLAGQVSKLEADRLKDVPLDTAQEIKALKVKLADAQKERDTIDLEKAALAAQIRQLQAKINSLQKTNKLQKSGTSDAEQKLKTIKAEHVKEMKHQQAQLERKFQETTEKQKKKIEALERTIKETDIAAAGGGGKGTKGGADPKQVQEMRDRLRESKSTNAELKAKVRQLEADLKHGGGGGSGSSAETDRLLKKQEKLVKELEKRLDNEVKKNKKNEENLKQKDGDLAAANKDIKAKDAEIDKLKTELAALGLAAKESVELAGKVKHLEKDAKKMADDNKALADSFNSERVLRKKYYNMVEDMKGKIRVYCRVRPLSRDELARGNTTICKSPDEFTINLDTSRGAKEFQFDTVFMESSSQDKVFEDTNNLVQSAVDGYNVCIFAYGQTGSGKTFTIIGDREQRYPGIAPRAFSRIFELLDANKRKFKYKVSCYMLELYNDKLLDLFAAGSVHDDKLDIKKDKKGMVYVPGSEVKQAKNSKELFALFEEGSKTRHTASTKMNSESSRSHLVIGIIIETTNKTSGQVLKGKLSLVDLAGSERAAKTGAGAEQLKEAMSINKSLSALGDVISALSSEQSFIPYRNNKLTMLMQDSLGGNAKTLMFVNISPADYNTDESVISLTYASRVKLITNDAQKNADNKEIARLKAVILKMKKGEKPAEDEVD